MDPTSANPTAGFTAQCVCCKTFVSPAAFKNHENSCKAQKDTLSVTLAAAKRKAVALRTDIQEVGGDQDSGASNVPSSSQGNVPAPPSGDPPSSDTIQSERPVKRPRKAGLPSKNRDFVSSDKPWSHGHCDVLPQPLVPIRTSSTPEPNDPAPEDIFMAGPIDTPENAFGLFRRYQTAPTHDPESSVSAEVLSKVTCKSSHAAPSYAPYPNLNAFKLGKWYWLEGIKKSQESFSSLMGIVSDKDFVPDDVRGVNWTRINQELGMNDWDGDEWEDVVAGWQVSSVYIQVPFHRNNDQPGEKLKQKKVDMPHFHLKPYDLMWCRNLQEEPIHLYGEIYTSSSFSQAHRNLQLFPPVPGCDLPQYVLALMFWSDGTHLTDFGNASLTPCYMQFGNESKYRRCKPSAHLMEHMAYFQELPDEFKAFASQYIRGSKIKSEFLSHCRREFAHAQWRLLLDDKFVEAYKHGFVVKWDDEVSRRFYPRIFSYSVDYKEKALMATVRMNSLVPCPRSKIPKANAHLFGTKQDRKAWLQLERLDDEDRQTAISKARDKIYKENFAVDSAAVKHLLASESLVPTVNAFSEHLGPELLGPNWFSIFAVDLLHEVELGIWKHLFIHLLWMLDFIKVLQTNKVDQSDASINILDEETTRLGNSLWDFQAKTCPQFETHKLQKEQDTREHKEAAQAKSNLPSNSVPKPSKKSKGKAKAKDDAAPQEASVIGSSNGDGIATGKPKGGCKPRTFTMNGYEAHAMGDYVAAVKKYGTTDSYSTELQGKLEHHWPKGNYKRTSKKQFQRQLAQIEWQHTRIRHIQERINVNDASTTDWDQPNFMGDLKVHLLPREKLAFDIPINPDEPPQTPDQTIFFAGEMLYRHKILRVNYTAYDRRCAQDVFNPQTNHHDMMLLVDSESNRAGHQFRYAQIVDIFHVNALYSARDCRGDYTTKTFYILLVRWFELLADFPVDKAWTADHPRLDS
ncbi:hypothetical protein DXG01_000630, partial [Tephrocybe rancida]